MKAIIVFLMVIALYIGVGYTEGPIEQRHTETAAIYTSEPVETRGRAVATASNTKIERENICTPVPVFSLDLITEELPQAPIYTDEEVNLVGRVVYAEARGEPWEGKVATAEVVLDRYESGKYGKTLAKVTRPSQFAKASERTVKKARNALIYAECIEAVQYAIKERTLPGNTYHFQKANRPYWGKSKTIKRYCTIGNHTFYTVGDPAPVPVFAPDGGQ